MDLLWSLILDISDEHRTSQLCMITSLRMLLSTDARAVSQASFGQGTGPIYLTGVACGSTQNRLIDCQYSTNTSDDTHAEDAGVRCSGPCK